MSKNKLRIIRSALVLTLGQQDIQVKFKHDGKFFLAKPGKDNVREFTTALRDRKLNYNPIDLITYCSTDNIEEKIKLSDNERVTPYLVMKDDLKEFAIEISSSGEKIKIPLDTSSPIDIYLPMIVKMLKSLEIQKKDTDYKIEKVLILYSERKNRPGEPVGAFEVIRSSLSEYFQLNEEDIIPIKYITEGFYDASTVDGIKTVKTEIAQKIFNSVKKLKSEYDINHVFASIKSGIPDVNRLCHESLLYWYYENLSEISSRQHQGKDTKVSICPIESIKLRRKARALLADGDFAGALILANNITCEEQVDSDSNYDKLRSYISNLHEFMILGSENKRKFEKYKIYEFINKIQESNYSETIRLAFRVENSLQLKNIPNVITSLFSFRDVISWQAINETICLKEKPKAVNIRKNYINLNLTKPEIVKKIKDAGYRINSKSVKLGENSDIRGVHTPLRIFLIEKSRQLKLKNMLKQFDSAVNNKSREVRNSITHGSVSESQLKSAMRILERKKVFVKTESFYTFLFSPYIRDLISNICKIDAGTLYKDFHNAVLDDIDKFDL